MYLYDLSVTRKHLITYGVMLIPILQETIIDKKNIIHELHWNQTTKQIKPAVNILCKPAI